MPNKIEEKIQIAPYFGLAPNLWYCVDYHPWKDNSHGYFIIRNCRDAVYGITYRFVLVHADNAMDTYTIFQKEVQQIYDRCYVAPQKEAEICDKLLSGKTWATVGSLKLDLICLHNLRKEEDLVKI
jgi:hypothetical protein